MKRKTKKTIIFELILIGFALSLVLLISMPEKEILGLVIKEDSLINVGNIEANVSEEVDGIITGQVVLEPEQSKEINVTENKTYYGRKNEE